MATLITSQHYINDEMVSAKVAASDFGVTVSPEFELFGETFQVVLDGNHSLAAALIAGVSPEITVANLTDHDAVALIASGEIEGFLEAVHMGEGDYIDAITRKSAW